MKAFDVQGKQKTALVITELRKHGYTNVDDKTYRELKHKLAVLRIKAENPENSWF